MRYFGNKSGITDTNNNVLQNVNKAGDGFKAGQYCALLLTTNDNFKKWHIWDKMSNNEIKVCGDLFCLPVS